MNPGAYLLFLFSAILLSGFLWWRRGLGDSRMGVVYACGLIGAFLGAKLAWVLCEGFVHFGEPGAWRHWAAGKSILGALPGGYAGVELGKWWTRFPHRTGDWFASFIPMSLILGRLGCLFHGCCQGIRLDGAAPGWWLPGGRWPSVPVEIIFNSGMLLLFFLLRKQGRLRGQHFHLFLIAYGVFRFFHEFLRETPRIAAGFSGYQALSLAMAMFGALAFWRRRRLGVEPRPS